MLQRVSSPDHTSVFVSPGDGMVQLGPRTVGIHFNRLLPHTWTTLGYYCSRSGHGNALMETMCVWYEPTPVCSRKLGACHGSTHPTLHVKSDRQYKPCCSDNHIKITTHAKSLTVPFYFAQNFTFTYLLTF